MVDLRPRIALISCNTAARLLSTCTKCEESRANGIGRPPAWIPLLLSGFDIFAIKKFTYSITYETARARTMFSAKSITVRNPSTRLSPITSTELPLSRSSTSRPKLHSVWIRSRQINFDSPFVTAITRHTVGENNFWPRAPAMPNRIKLTKISANASRCLIKSSLKRTSRNIPMVERRFTISSLRFVFIQING